ncbi:hypothetical protein SAMN05444287_2119 [Octadecabacter temperatus]|uniref:Uncharacterized protein n=1 Tax=Octadecabacter temperatus TaxID=1458307 RepID=A0A0K0Y7P6_9RHOB|nr:hypothetical protein [Octadecabacter temperatus]AKS46994.1 hypothetical protein OSB_24590 [Octadecabacter temperatus]SIO24887.1 hypothetical protein SAMN05444287_2119 [Octadecabacter temperatus]
MINITKVSLGMAVLSLSACGGFEGTRTIQGPNDYIAVAGDLGRDSDGHLNDVAGIAVTPDGCQAWVIDDGIEGRASNRLDPVSGLPVCVGEPGVVYGPYESGTPGIADRVPGEPVPVSVQQVPVRTTTGHFHTVHPVSEPHH